MHIFNLTVCIFTIMYSVGTTAFSWKNIYTSIIPSKMQQEIVYEEYSPKNATVLRIKNKKGNINVKTDKNQSTIFLKAIKKSHEPELFPQLTFTCIPTPTDIIIEPSFDESSIAGIIDFECIIPGKLAVNASTCEGNIYTKHLSAPSILTAQRGNIEIVDSYNCIDATTYDKGNITFYNPHKRIKAQTKYGNIRILDAQESVIANAHYGTIEMFAKEIPSTSTIKLATVTGPILLHLPPTVNAELYASTKQGIITSDHFITLKPQTTQLNKTAWNRLQKEVEGSLGSGEAQIKLSSVRSNIKLLELKA